MTSQAGLRARLLVNSNVFPASIPVSQQDARNASFLLHQPHSGSQLHPPGLCMAWHAELKCGLLQCAGHKSHRRASEHILYITYCFLRLVQQALQAPCQVFIAL